MANNKYDRISASYLAETTTYYHPL